MAKGEQAHAPTPSRRRHWTLRRLPELLVLLVVATAFVQLRYDVPGSWLGLEAPDPDTNPAAVLPPEGLDLPLGAPAPEVAADRVPVEVDRAALAAAIAPYANDKDLGPHADIAVTDLSTGRIVYRSGSGPLTPASTLKILTSAAALETLGSEHRFATTVRRNGNRIVLVGGGDPYLAASPKTAKGEYPSRMDLDTLAARTAAALAPTKRVRLGYDDTLFSGPAMNPAWPDSYGYEGVVPPITALWADQGRGRATRWADDPSKTAADVFRAALQRHGIKVVGPVVRQRAGAQTTVIARGMSAPVGQIVEKTLAVSDNQAAEVLARHVGLAVLDDGSFAGGAEAIRQVLAGLGVPTDGIDLYDGSGLSRSNLVAPRTLLAVLGLAADDAHPGLREILTGLPVAGYTGSLRWRFDEAPVAAKGMVRAKTGTLTGVHGLAGVAVDRSGAELAFVAIADRVGDEGLRNLKARERLDELAAALGNCTCGR